MWTLGLPSFGASARHRPLEIKVAAQAVGAFLERHRLERPLFVGHSMGAHIGLYVAARVPLRCLVLVLLQAARHVLSDDPIDVLPEVTCPTLLIWGERDIWVTKAMGEALLGQLSRAQLEVIPGAAHIPMMDRPMLFDAVLLDWLQAFSTNATLSY